MPDFRDYAIAVPKPAQARIGNTRPLGGMLRDVLRLNPDNFRVFGPDETTSNRLDAIYEASKRSLARRDAARRRRRRRPGRRRARDGDALRAHPRGLARGLPADRPPRLLLDLRGLRPRHRLDVQPARQVARHRRRPRLARARGVAEPADHLDGLAPGPQRLHAPGSGLPRPRRRTRAPRSRASTCRRTSTPCSRSPTTACAARTT